MRVLVIGGTGFIGKGVVRELASGGHAVAIFHRGQTRDDLPGTVESITGDRKRLGERADALRAFAPDVVVDMILSSGTQARDLVEIFRGVARRVVAVSSMDVYRAVGVVHGSEPGGLEPLPLREDSPRRSTLQTYPRETIKMLQHTFAWLDEEYDKIPVEDAVLSESGFEGVVLRLPMVYGPGDPLRRFAGLVKEMHGNPDELVFNASEAAWRGTRGYVDDAARAIAQAATRELGAHRVFNVGERDALSELDWARLVASAAGWSGRFVVLPADAPDDSRFRMRGNFAQHWVADTSRIRHELGYRESIDREEAVRRTVESYRV